MLKKQKFAVYEKQCSKVAEGLYVSGEAVARDRSILAEHRITHVVNCVGALYQEFHKNDGISYKTLWLNDIPGEDITSILYDTFDFIESARKGPGCSSSSRLQQPQMQQQQQQAQQEQAGSNTTVLHAPVQLLPMPQQGQDQQCQQQFIHASRCTAGDSEAAGSQAGDAAAGCSSCGGGRVLVHCSQGVSRSTTIAIAYMMMKTGGSYEEVYQTVRAMRGVTSPNVGFMCQLINWAKRRQHKPSRLRMYRIAPHCADAPTYLVAKTVNPKSGCSYADWSCLDQRGCFLLHLPDKLYVWQGSDCIPALLEAGLRAAGGMVRYEGTPQPQLVKQGEEPDDLLLALNPSCGGMPDSALASVEPSSVSIGLGVDSRGGSCAVAAGMEDEEVLSRVPSATGTRICGGQQQPQQQPWLACGAVDSSSVSAAGDMRCSGTAAASLATPAAAAAIELSSCKQGAACSSGSLFHSAFQEQMDNEDDSIAAGAVAMLTSQMSKSGLQGVVTQVEEYNNDFELLRRTLIKNGACSDAGRLTPRGSRTSLAVDDMAVGSGSSSGDGSGIAGSAGCSGRDDSPTTESQQQKRTRYRRSESESSHMVAPSMRQPGRLSTSSNPAPWTAAAAVATVNNTAASTAAQAAAVEQAAHGPGRVSDVTAEQGCDIKRMSIDEAED